MTSFYNNNRFLKNNNRPININTHAFHHFMETIKELLSPIHKTNIFTIKITKRGGFEYQILHVRMGQYLRLHIIQFLWIPPVQQWTMYRITFHQPQVTGKAPFLSPQTWRSPCLLAVSKVLRPFANTHFSTLHLWVLIE